ncbi:MAG: OmpA family protein [Magnetospiraceae bacterium]
MKFRSSIAVATLLAIAPLTASAGDISGPYVSLGAGVNLHIDPTYNIGGVSRNIDMDYGWAGIGALGWGYDSGLRGEVELGFRNNNIDSINGTALTTEDVSVLSLMGNLLYDFDLDSSLTPYLGLGVGAAKINTDTPLFDDSDTVLAGQAIAGVNYAVTEQLNLFLDYRYFITADPDFTPNVSGEYQAHTVLAGLRWELTPPPAPVAEPMAPIANQYIVFFDFDKSSLTDDAERIISLAADNSKKASVTKIATTGHADRSGSDTYNMGLSQRRAEAVKAELVRLGVAADAIYVRWKGERDPLVQTADGVREPQNRRVVIVFE